MKLNSILLAGAASIMAVSAALPASGQVYSAPAGLAGNQNFNGTIGLNFTVNAPIQITSIGVFDSGANGLTGNLSAALYNSAGVALLNPVTFAAGTTNNGSSAYLFQSITPLTLTAGTYQIAAWGFTSADPNYNFYSGAAGSPITFDTLGGRLTATSSSYGFAQGAYANFPDSGALRYGSGSFIAAAVPEPAAWAMMIVGMGAIGVLMRRRVRASEVKFDAKIKQISKSAVA